MRPVTRAPLRPEGASAATHKLAVCALRRVGSLWAPGLTKLSPLARGARVS